MPNWCYNELTVTGDKEEVKRFAKFVRGNRNDFDFDKVIPYPEKFRKMDEEEPMRSKGFNAGGYEWCLNNWGTKWNSCETSAGISVDGTTFGASFDTAWSPPVPVIIKLAELFPTLRIKLEWEEGGMDFSGYLILQDNIGLEEGGDGDYGAFPVTEHPNWDEEEVN